MIAMKDDFDRVCLKIQGRIDHFRFTRNETDITYIFKGIIK
jgi:hypothetical protein